ncbi:MAG: TonB-dependent receptor domain-containing protein [Rhodomicrobium sp.]
MASPGLAQQAPAPTASGTAPKEEQTTPAQPAAGSTGNEAKTPGATQLPPVKVIQKPAKPAKPLHRPVAGKPEKGTATAAASPSGAGQPAAPSAEQAANAAVTQKANNLNAARENILPKIGVNSFQFSQQDIEALPQADNLPVDKLLLQTPGIAQDSAASGNLHIRNEHSNLQYRIDGIQLPDGVSGFGSFGNELETSLIANMTVITGALPAQYGLRTAGLVDIQTKMGTAEPSGEISVYGGSHDTINTNIQYGGVDGNTQYYFTGRWLENDVGIENPTSSVNAIHDETEQEKFFSYVSTVLPNNSRWTMITGASDGQYQIPNNPGQPVNYYYTPPTGPTLTNFDSSKLNENQIEQNYYAVLAFQQSTGFADYQFSYFTRYSSLHYTPDLIGDLMFNGIATDETRTSFLNGIQADAAFRVAPDHTVRIGMVVSGEQSDVTDNATVFLTGNCGAPNPTDPTQGTQLCANGQNGPGKPVAAPINVVDQEDKFGWIAGVYMQDEWKITNQLTLNSGLRFDEMWQYVDANQLSPRIAAVYKPLDGTTFHAGYARNFTPPPQAVGAPENYALFYNTTAAPQVSPETVSGLKISPSLPERSNVYDTGVTQIIAPGLEAGLDVYYKTATDLLDDGQFGQAYTLTAFNYAKGENEGLEAKLKYPNSDGVLIYGNFAWARQYATDVVSNQYLFNPLFYEYALTNLVATDHSQTLTASAGISYPIWDHTKASVDWFYGSGLRSGDFNQTTVSPYNQVNLGLSHEFILDGWKPFTLRFDVVNLLDDVYEIRSGSGVGVFAPQYGPRRGFFVGYSQKF